VTQLSVGWRDVAMALIDSFGVLLLGLESAADPEHVAIGMAKVHLANVPRHVGGRKCDLQPGGDAVLVHLVRVAGSRFATLTATSCSSADQGSAAWRRCAGIRKWSKSLAALGTVS
jgi:hypothetical protein